MVPTHINDMEPLSNNASTLKMEEMIKTVLHKLNGKIDSSEARLEYQLPREKAWHTSSLIM